MCVPYGLKNSWIDFHEIDSILMNKIYFFCLILVSKYELINFKYTYCKITFVIKQIDHKIYEHYYIVIFMLIIFEELVFMLTIELTKV